MNVTITVSEEAVRRLARYRLTDRRLSQKYGITFDEFERQQMTKRQGYTWEVESDAMAWEMAIDGIRSFSDEPGNPWLETAGLFADDDTLELMLQEIYAERAAERLVA